MCVLALRCSLVFLGDLVFAGDFWVWERRCWFALFWWVRLVRLFVRLTCWLVLWVLLWLLGFGGCNLWYYGLLGLCFAIVLVCL